MFTANILPGKGFHTFNVHRSDGGISDGGRIIRGDLQDTGVSFLGMLVNANQKEQDQWKQNGHPVTHKIIEYSAQNKAMATDYLIAHNEREFYVQGVKNPGDLNVTMIYYVEERFDIKRKP